jgi:hypothetical protein
MGTHDDDVNVHTSSCLDNHLRGRALNKGAVALKTVLLNASWRYLHLLLGIRFRRFLDVIENRGWSLTQCERRQVEYVQDGQACLKRFCQLNGIIQRVIRVFTEIGGNEYMLCRH